MRVNKEYEYIEHTADIGIKVYGSSMEELFKNAGLAFFNILTEPAKIEPLVEKVIVVENKGWDRLLVSWLSELLYLFEVEQWLFRECQIEYLSEDRLEAIGFGEKFDPDRHEIKTDIKAVTYHNLLIQKKDEIWQTVIILDV